MKPTLHDANSVDFDNNGIGVLVDALSCEVTEELNGIYELSMRYPITGRYYSEIKLRALIVAKPNKSDTPQPFRIYRITKPLNGIVTIYAEHISYDLSGIPVNPFTANNAKDAVAAIKANCELQNPFVIYTDKTTSAKMTVDTPRSARACISGQQGSLVDTYTGNLHFDRYKVSLLTRRGADNGVKLVYGKNLTDLKQEENISVTYTGIYPYAVDMNGVLTVLSEKILHAEGNFGFERIKEVDLSSEFQSEEEGATTITEDMLRDAALRYMSSHSFGKPKVSINVSFVNLADTVEYQNIAFLEDVALGDSVMVEFIKLGVSVVAKCVKTIFNALTEKFSSVVIGETNKTISDSLADVPTKEYIKQEDNSTRAALTAAIQRATAVLNGANGGVFEILDENNDGINDAWILRSYDNLKYLKATKDGIGITTDGGNTYTTALTADGINASAITTGILSAERIDADNLKVRAANITGELHIGQMPSEVAYYDEIPTNVSELKNDAGYQTRNGVVSIVDGRVTADYINALGVTANSLLVKDASGNTLFNAAGTNVQIAGFDVSGTAISAETRSTDNYYNVMLDHQWLTTEYEGYYSGSLREKRTLTIGGSSMLQVTAENVGQSGAILPLMIGTINNYSFAIIVDAINKTLSVI